MATTFDFDFRTTLPPPPLDRAVASIWYARGRIPYRRERIAPTGSTVAVIVLGAPILESTTGPGAGTILADTGFLIGPHDRPVLNEPTGETFAVGIVTTPIGCRAALGVEPATIAGRVIDLASAWADTPALRADLSAAHDPLAMLTALTARLAASLDLSDPGLDRCERAVALLEADPTLPIAEVAARVGVSHGHLDREFTRIVGISPRRLARLRRVQRLLATIPVHGDVDWADLAADLGWSDQSHLIRDVKRHTGVTPSAYLAAQRAWAAPSETDAWVGFVPDAM